MSSKNDDIYETQPALISRVQQNEEDGWTEFYQLYRDFIHASAQAAGLNHEEGNDVVQETMVSVRKYIEGFEPDRERAKFRTWLRKIVRSRIADQFRKKRRNPLEFRTDEGPRADEGSHTSFTNRIPDLNDIELDRVIDGKLEQAILDEARERAQRIVKPRDYEVYDLFAIRDMSAAEVAKKLQINATTIRVKTFRVRRIVDQELRRIAASMDSPSAKPQANQQVIQGRRG